MKNTMIRLLSALLLLCMIFGTLSLPVMADGEETSEATSDVTSEEVEEDVITAETILKKTTYSSAEEKLASMTLYYEAYGLELYAHPITGEVAIRDKKTGQIVSTNPYDAGKASTSADTLKKLFSQLYVNYTDTAGKASVLYSYTDAAMLDQIKIARIKGGIRLDYTIGRADTRRLCPMSVEKSRWEENLWAYIEDSNAHKKFWAMYTLYDPTDPELTESVLASYYDLYPVTKEGMAIYVMAESSTNYEKNKVEEWIKAWCPHYTYEDMEYDHELTKYVASSEVMPVFKMSLEYKLDASGFTVRLPANSITFNEDYYTLSNVTVLPFFGAGSSEFTGYTFVPDGSGTIIRFEDVANTTYMFTGELYGPDNAYHTLSPSYTGKAEIMRVPCFGLVENRGYFYKLDENGKETNELYCAHNNKTAGETVKPTCTEDGYTLYTCDACGVELKDDIVKAAHSYASEVTEPTCAEKGYTTYTCKVCGDSYTDKETAPKHPYEKKVTAPTCTERGYTTYTCPVCGDSYVGDYTDPTHKYKEIENEKTVKMTCTTDGYATYECEICHDSYETVVYAHHTINYSKGTATGEYPKSEVESGRKSHQYYDFTCSACKETIRILNHNSDTNKEEKNFNHMIGKKIYAEGEEGDCRSYGRYTGHCRLCDVDVTVVTEPGHAYTSVITAPTCTAGGYTTYTCKTCGYSYVGAYTDAKHSYVDTVTDATCSSNGYTTRVCSGCGDVKIEKYTAAGHDWDKGVPQDDGTTRYTCMTCFVTSKVPGYVKATSKRGSSIAEDLPIPSEKDYIGVVVEDPTSDVTSGETSDVTSGETSDVTSGETSDVTSGETSDVTSGATSGETSGATSGETSGATSGETGKVEADTKVPDGAYRKYISRGWFAMIEEGDTLCTITSSHGGVLHKYNSVYISVNPRPSDQYNLADSLSVGSDSPWTVTSKRKYTGSYTLRFFLLGEGNDYEASYSGMAKVYRDYLTSIGVLTALKANKDGIPLVIEALGAVKTQTTIMSIPVYVMTPLTTFEDLKAITADMQSEGIKNINYRLNGYTTGGMNPLMPYKLSFEKTVGGNDGYSDFLKYAADNGIGVYPEFDLAYEHSSKMFDGFSYRKHAVKTIDDRYIVKMKYDSNLQIFSNTGLLAVSPSVFDYFYEHMKQGLSKLGYSGISLGTLGSDLNSDFDKKEPYNREDSKEFVVDLLQKVKEDSGDNAMVDGGNAYAFGYVRNILNMPLAGSEYLNTSASVPFIGMVLHGSINYSGTPTNQASSTSVEVLRMIESGANPYFILSAQNTQALKENWKLSTYYSISYENWKTDIDKIYKKVNEALKDLQDVKFVEHELLNGERVAEESELAEDQARLTAALESATEKYEAAQLAYNNARDLYDRFIAERRITAAKSCYENIETTKKAYEEAKKAYEEAKKAMEPRTADYDANGKYIVSKYSVTDGSIVRVTYENGKSYILNYNDFSVTVKVNGKDLTIAAFNYIVA